MAAFFQYDQLTWPEIDALPRHTPLILPLGSGYPLDRLAGVFNNPDEIGLLPAVPFGWRGSGLRVADHLLGAYLENLLDSLREEGFFQVFALTPQGLELGLRENHLALPLPQQGLLSSDVLPPSSEMDKVILIPIGHTEQHGYHLPMSTDTLIIDAIAQGTAAADSQHAFTLPVMPYGVSTHRQAFAGTLNAGGRAFEDFWLGVIEVLVNRGFTRFYLLSGHGGNSSFLANIVKYAGERHRRIFCATAFLYLSGPEGVAALEKYRRSKIGGMGHACELETALILHLRPDLVHMERVVDETDFITTQSYYMDWVEGGALVANPPWEDDTATGAYGAGSLATAEHGKIWLEAAIREKIGHVSEIHEQHLRREQKRSSGFGLWGK
jgi:creatinine amidohydrolase